jgi:thiosulfate reductase cytochrome b subunit
MLKDPANAPREDRMRLANGPCIECHSETVVRVGGREGAVGIGMAHDWLPHPESHAKMRCIVCHSPPQEAGIHEVLDREGSARDCDQCHTGSSDIIAKFVGEDDRSAWITNPGLFEFAYVRGTTRNWVVDKVLIGLLIATVIGIFGHALLRVLLCPKKTEPYVVKEVRLYSVVTRLGHWINALLMTVLILTGMRIHFGGRERALMTFEEAFHTHNLVGAITTVVAVVFVAVHVFGGGVKQYLWFRKGHVAGSVEQARWYLFGIFKGDPKPFHATPERRFNPMQQTAYATLMWGALPALVVTGILLLYPNTIPETLFGQDGKWLVSTIHYLVSWGFTLFVVGHMYLITMGDKPGYALSAMITGVHRHHEPAPAAKAEEEDGHSDDD